MKRLFLFAAFAIGCALAMLDPRTWIGWLWRIDKANEWLEKKLGATLDKEESE